MATPKHTPGPWVAGKSGNDEYIFAPHHAPQICNLPAFAPENEANARLISAAPELLASLRAMLHGEKTALSNAEWSVILGNARAAVEKAEGAAPEVIVSITKPARVAPPLPEPSTSANQHKKR